MSEAVVVKPACLYVVATPIGNLGDLSPRAQAVLAAVDRIATEDTRTSGVLLSHFGIRRPLVALHDHNEDQITTGLVSRLRGGESLALISDAGTPLVSDPGFALVRAARAAGVEVIAIPGPCAAVAALSIAGIASDSFSFAGFLPSKPGARRERLVALSTSPHTLIVYESSHRIADCVTDLAQVFGARSVCLAREISKTFEQSVTCAAHELPAWIATDPNRQRGEFVLVIEGAPPAVAGDAEADRVLRALLPELSAARAAKVAATLTGRPRKHLYARALTLGGEKAEPEA